MPVPASARPGGRPCSAASAHSSAALPVPRTAASTGLAGSINSWPIVPWLTPEPVPYRPECRRSQREWRSGMTSTERAVETAQQTEHVDVLIVGAGISGIGAAHHLRERFPGRSFVVLDALEDRGGTWWTHRYPGARSDSDLFTFGYRFKPWRGPSIATSEEILSYLDEVTDEDDPGDVIRYRHRVTAAAWSTEDRRWTVQVTRDDTGEQLRFTTDFLWMCQGYYDHSGPHRPQWEGMDRFGGVVVHPQKWPEDLDHAGKRVVVIGSGATAATLIPAIAKDCAHVTMLQRSPTFFRTGRNAIEIADELRKLQVDEAWIHEIERFTETGIQLKSGKMLDADIIVTATGFHLSVLGDIDVTIDGDPLVFSDTVTYRGMMFTGVPNMAWVFGYFRASWTLRADLVADFVCRLLNHMRAIGAKRVEVALRPEDRDMPILPWIDPQNFNPGYLMRGMQLLPKRGDKPEWQHTQDYWAEKDAFPAIDLDDAAFVYG